jgi:predicted nuclease of predicted toxin-antitoxin system
MTQKIRFHLDENVSNAIAEGLRRRGIDVTTTSEAKLIAASDREQLAFALSENRVIFTHDDDFVVLHQSGVVHSGITYCDQNRRSIGEILMSLILIWEIIEPEEMKNQLEFL